MANNSYASFFPVVLVGLVDHTLSIPANTWALWLIFSGRRTLFKSEFLTVNLMSMELAFSLFFFLNLLQYYHLLFIFKPLINLYQGMAVVGRALFQCHICMDRYLAVVHPMIFIRYKQIKYRGPCLAALWLVVFACGLHNVVTPLKKFVILSGTFAVLAPSLCIELFCSLSILSILRRSRPGAKEAGKKEGNKQKIRAIKITLLTLAMLILNVLPYLLSPLLIPLYSMAVMAVVFQLSTLGSATQALLFLNRVGKLPCKA